jgi:hypothetical protein
MARTGKNDCYSLRSPRWAGRLTSTCGMSAAHEAGRWRLSHRALSTAKPSQSLLK